MEQWILDLNQTLVLELLQGEGGRMAASPFYKLYLKRYVDVIAEDTVIFKRSLNYLDFNKIIRIVSGEAAKRKIGVTITEELRQYISSKELYIEQRSRLGIEIKNHDPKLNDRFMAYKSVVDERMARKLREQQRWDSFFMYSMKKSANFSVPGAGKTACVLGVYAFLRAKEGMRKIIVICPKNAFGSWIDEFRACFGDKELLHYFNIHDSGLNNTTARRHALMYNSGNCNLILINYESLGSVDDIIIKIMGSDTLLVFDEVHKVKRLNGEYASHALNVARVANRVIAMTGTPIPNTYLDIYNLLNILYPDEYDSFFNFPISTLNDPNDEDIGNINSKIQPFFCRTTKDKLGVPKADPDKIIEVSATDCENQILNYLCMRYGKSKLALLIRIMQLESGPEQLLYTLDMNEYRYLMDDSAVNIDIDAVDFDSEVKTLISQCGDPMKFRTCINEAERITAQGKVLIIWCVLKRSILKISEALNSRGIATKCIYGEVALDERQEILDRFKSGKIQVLITNPHTLAESVSLHTVCHDAIYYEYSYNLVHLLQSKDRIHRLGLPDGQYTQYEYLRTVYQLPSGDWSMGEEIYDRLLLKEQIMLDAIDNNTLESMPTSKEDLDVIFKGLL